MLNDIVLHLSNSADRTLLAFTYLDMYYDSDWMGVSSRTYVTAKIGNDPSIMIEPRQEKQESNDKAESL